MGIIRLLLAIAVFNSHFPFLDLPVVDGHEAVLAFFVISGFYMALILDTPYISAKGFYLGRFLSLYPIYIFALMLSIALLMTWDIHPMTSLAHIRSLLADPISLLVMLWTSACVLGQEILFSLGQSLGGGLHVVESGRSGIWSHAPLIQAWSLSLEIMFYALAPFLVRMKSHTLVGLIVVSLTLKVAIMTSSLADISFFKRFFPADFWLFGCGIMVYRLYKLLPQQIKITDGLFFITLIVTICVADLAPEKAEPFVMPAAIIMALPLVFRLFRDSRFDRIIGKISYPFYLIHFSVIAVFEEYWDEPAGVYVLAAALVSAVLVHSVFHPGIEFLKQRIRILKQPSSLDDMAVQPGLFIAKP